MAAPTDVRVEALSISSTILRWVHASPVAVYRSTDGISYSEIAVAEDSYTDIDLATATKYWYKLTDDSGATFSSVVTVITHACAAAPNVNVNNLLPRAEGEVVSPEVFDDLAVKVETGWTRFTDPNGRTCVACISDGALVIDCVNYDMCDVIEVEVTEDVNSISMPNCDNDIKEIDFIIPPNTTRRICGFPAGSGFSGDECFRAPILAGAAGRTISTSSRKQSPKSRPGVSGRGGGGAGGSACTCVPTADGILTIKSCNANNSLSCSSSKKLDLKACGGRGPYTWSKTGDVTLQTGNNGTPGATAEGSSIIVKPPTNSGSTVVGKAYVKAIFGVGCGHSLGTTHAAGQTKASYNCDDTLNTCPDGAVGTTATVLAFSDSTCSCSVHSGHAVSGAGAIVEVSCTHIFATGAECAAAQSIGSVGDIRTAPMIAAGCTPCGLQAGATVSVTDSMGTVATIILRA